MCNNIAYRKMCLVSSPVVIVERERSVVCQANANAEHSHSQHIYMNTTILLFEKFFG